MKIDSGISALAGDRCSCRRVVRMVRRQQEPLSRSGFTNGSTVRARLQMSLDAHQVGELGLALDERMRKLSAGIPSHIARAREDEHVYDRLPSESCGKVAIGHLVETDNAALSRGLDQLAELQAARLRLGAGTFGRCVDCGTDMEYEELLADPARQRCHNCGLQRTIRVPE